MPLHSLIWFPFSRQFAKLQHSKHTLQVLSSKFYPNNANFQASTGQCKCFSVTLFPLHLCCWFDADKHSKPRKYGKAYTARKQKKKKRFLHHILEDNHPPNGTPILDFMWAKNNFLFHLRHHAVRIFRKVSKYSRCRH